MRVDLGPSTDRRTGMDGVLTLLKQYKYFAMFGILCLCGVGLPIPEELTLLAGGFAVGWQWADYYLSCLFGIVGILAGDCVIFGVGRHFGRWFFASRPVRLLLPRRRQANVAMLLKRKVKFDSKKYQFMGDDEADLFLAREQRSSWQIVA